MKICTYATHNERYFPILLESCRRHNIELVNIGEGKVWNGFKGRAVELLKYCNTLDSNEIVCCIDGFDTIVLTSYDEIETKFRKMNKEIVFSKGGNASGFLNKYIQQKMFQKCAQDLRANAGMLIAYVRSLKRYLKDYIRSDEHDDQIFLSKNCGITEIVHVDINNDLFYNFNHQDEYKIVNNRMYYNNTYPCFLSGPFCKDMGSLFKALGYSTIPEPTCNTIQRVKEYIKLFIPEILTFALIGLFWLSSVFKMNVLQKVLMSFVFVLALIEYELFLKHVDNIGEMRKSVYIITHIIHDFISLAIVFVLFYIGGIVVTSKTVSKFTVLQLYVFNAFYFGMLMLFFYFGRCVITIIENKLLKVDDHTLYMNIPKRLRSIMNDSYFETRLTSDSDFMVKWIKGNMMIISTLFVVNAYMGYRLYKQNRK